MIIARCLAAALSATLALAASAPAWAQPVSVVGVWSKTQRDQAGQTFAVIWDEFGPDGRIHVRFVTRAGTEDYFGVYQLTNGGAMMTVRFQDYQPKQLCTLVCSPITPVVPMNQPVYYSVQFAGPATLYLSGDRFNRQR